MKKLIKTLALVISAAALAAVAAHFTTYVIYVIPQEREGRELIERLDARHHAYFNSLSDDEKLENLKFKNY